MNTVTYTRGRGRVPLTISHMTDIAVTINWNYHNTRKFILLMIYITGITIYNIGKFYLKIIILLELLTEKI